jgi:hypothetical protein
LARISKNGYEKLLGGAAMIIGRARISIADWLFRLAYWMIPYRSSPWGRSVANKLFDDRFQPFPVYVPMVTEIRGVESVSLKRAAQNPIEISGFRAPNVNLKRPHA